MVNLFYIFDKKQKMKQNILLILVTIFGIQLNAQLVSYEKIDSFTVAELQAQIVAIGFGSLLTPEYPVDLYRVMYRTEFLDSTTVISGALAVPRNTICKVPMVNYAHGTSSKKLNVPSYDGAEKNIVVFFASIGNVVCASDFIGLGASNISLHPYMHGFSQAHSSLNIMRATRELKNELDINLGNQIYSFGYSQGGFVSAMLVKYIEQWYSDEFKITAAAPMSGPYNIHGAQYEMVNSGEPYATPGYLPYIIFSYQMMYGGLYDNVSEIFKNPYDTLMPILFEGHQNSIGYISGEAAPIPTDMIIDSVQNDINTNPYHKFRLALFDNDLLRWTPKTPMKLLYCEGDEQVSYRNSQIADSLWNYNGANNISSINHGDFTHSSCLPFALLAGLDFFKSFGNNGVEIVVEYNENNNSFEASILHDEIADYDIARGEVAINHLNGQREIKVDADLVDNKDSASDILDNLRATFMPQLLAKYPSVSPSYEGQNREAGKVQDSAKLIFPVILMLIYAVIAFTFRSYIQPLLLLLMVPLSVIGVGWGHNIHNFPINILSFLGIIALIGIMVNDGLVLIGKFNFFIKEGYSFQKAIYTAGLSRFRAIFLTSITTIAGLAPLIFETSFQAQFLIPMAISIAYGIGIATFLTLYFLPLLLYLNNDIKFLWYWLYNGKKPERRKLEGAYKEDEHLKEFDYE